MLTVHKLRFLLVVLGVSTAISRLGAQNAPAGAGATLVGTVYDSVRHRAIVGAVVRVDSSSLIAQSDADGHFRIEGVPAGAHYLRVEHPLLDTMGVVLRSAVETFAPGEMRTTELATPSQETLISLMCSPAWRQRGPAALVGRVRDADTGEPAVGAKVSLVWYEVDIQAGVKRVPRVRESVIGRDGTFRICGLPAQLDGKVQVLRGALTSGEILIQFGDDLFFMRNMSIAAPGAVAVHIDSSGQHPDSAKRKGPVVTMLGTARLTGKVINKAGAPLVGARVQLDGTNRVAVTRANGEFNLDSLPPGTQNVTARLLGYAPIDAAVDLVSKDSRNVTLQMTEFVPVLNEIRVTAQRERGLDDVGFNQRKRTGQGYFLDDKKINHDTRYFSDVLRTVPGLRISPLPGGNGSVVQSARDPNGCVVFWVDGTQWQTMEPGDIDDFVKPYELAAVEVYSGSTAPSQYQAPGQSSCSVIVAWTYRRLDKKPR